MRSETWEVRRGMGVILEWDRRTEAVEGFEVGSELRYQALLPHASDHVQRLKPVHRPRETDRQIHYIYITMYMYAQYIYIERESEIHIHTHT